MKHVASNGRRTLGHRARVGVGAIALLALVGGSVVVGGAASGAASTSKKDAGVVVRIADVIGGDAFYLALQDGTLQKAVGKYGATAKIVATFPAEAPALQTLAADAADFTSGSITATIGGLAGDSAVQVFAYEPDGVSKVPQEAILVKKDSGINTLKDLEGKTVAVNQAGSGEYMLDQALAYNHIAEDSVTKVYLQVPAGATAFAAGQVDAWSTFATYIPLAEEQDDAKVLISGSQVKSRNDGVEVVNTSFAKAHPELVKAVFDAIQAESEKTLKHPAAYDQFLETTDHVTPGGILNYANKTLAVWQPVTPTQEKLFQQVSGFFWREGAVPTFVDFADKVFYVSKVKA
jgi:sulfonate transport system substrate-binding protein